MMNYTTNNRLQLQFHITGHCNLQCKHCYRTEGDVEPLSYDDIVKVLNQFIALKNRYNQEHHIRKRGHVNLTGGEPFCHKDMREILSFLGTKKKELTYGILSNGSYIDLEMMQLLKETECSFVQVSIDGNRKTHDELRAPGDYDRVLDKAEELERHGIRTFVSFTANKKNFRHIPKVAKECRKRRISKLWTDRLVPIGNGKELPDLEISKQDMKKYIKTIQKAKCSMNRALQFIGHDGPIYSCSAGIGLITVDEFGRIMPCRRMPIICDDVFCSTLEVVYYHHEIFRNLRVREIPKECLQCEYSMFCRGGARCQSFAEYGTYDKADPACFLLQ